MSESRHIWPQVRVIFTTLQTLLCCNVAPTLLMTYPQPPIVTVPYLSLFQLYTFHCSFFFLFCFLFVWSFSFLLFSTGIYYRNHILPGTLEATFREMNTKAAYYARCIWRYTVFKFSNVKNTCCHGGHMGILPATKHLQIYIMQKHRQLRRKYDKSEKCNGISAMTVYHSCSLIRPINPK